jgi:hypothetical protein
MEATDDSEAQVPICGENMAHLTVGKIHEAHTIVHDEYCVFKFVVMYCIQYCFELVLAKDGCALVIIHHVELIAIR